MGTINAEVISEKKSSEQSHWIAKTFLTLIGSILGGVIWEAFSFVIWFLHIDVDYIVLILMLIVFALLGVMITAYISSVIFYNALRKGDLLRALATFLISAVISLIPGFVYEPSCSLNIFSSDCSTILFYAMLLFPIIFIIVGFFIFSRVNSQNSQI